MHLIIAALHTEFPSCLGSGLGCPQNFDVDDSQYSWLSFEIDFNRQVLCQRWIHFGIARDVGLGKVYGMAKAKRRRDVGLVQTLFNERAWAGYVPFIIA